MENYTKETYEELNLLNQILFNKKEELINLRNIYDNDINDAKLKFNDSEKKFKKEKSLASQNNRVKEISSDR